MEHTYGIKIQELMDFFCKGEHKGFSEEEITRFEECLDRIRKNLEEWQKS